MEERRFEWDIPKCVVNYPEEREKASQTAHDLLISSLLTPAYLGITLTHSPAHPSDHSMFVSVQIFPNNDKVVIQINCTCLRAVWVLAWIFPHLGSLLLWPIANAGKYLFLPYWKDIFQYSFSNCEQWVKFLCS